MNLGFTGIAFKFGDNINTDYIISSRRKRDTLDMNVLKQYLMEDIRPGFFSELREKNVMVGGENFGCGSAMEVAAQVVKENNFGAVLAKSFSRSYYRNCINNGLLVIQADTDFIDEGDEIMISMDADKIIIRDSTKGIEVSVDPYPENIKSIIHAGGIMNDLEGFMG